MPKKPEKGYVAVNFDLETHGRIKLAASAEGVSLSEFAKRAIVERAEERLKELKKRL